MIFRVLFICKRRSNYGQGPCSGRTFGLRNSARFVAEALIKLGLEAKVVEVTDNNDIDREVSLYKPTHVIIEALWVVPEKFPILLCLHPHVKWYCRMHSKTPFIAMEGVAMEWIKRYGDIAKSNKKFHVSANNIDFCRDIEEGLDIPCVYQPNIYENQHEGFYDFVVSGLKDHHTSHIDIGCFGAIRPLKNHLTQAIAAIRFGNMINRKVRFHINAERVEQRGETVLNNLRNLFPINGHELVEHEWLSHEDFLELVKTMEIGMQVSFSESFNIVAADFVVKNVPIVVSHDIDWLPDMAKANPESTDSIVNALLRVWQLDRVSWQSMNILYLNKHNKKAKKSWLKALSK